MNRSWVVLPFLVALAPTLASAASLEISEPFQGVRYIHRSTTEPRTLDMHVVEIDLTAPGLDFAITPANGAGPGETNGQTTREFLRQQAAQIAVNGSFSALEGGAWVVEGIAVDRGSVYSEFEEFRRHALNLSIDRVATIVRATSDFGTDHTPNVELYTTLGGEARLLSDGNNVAPSASESLQPRTAVGVSEDGLTLFLLTIDGRNSGHSLGVTRPEAADILRSFGAWDAVNLDGGGSTTLAMADPVPRVLNVPVGVNNEPGTERIVGSNFAVFAAPNSQPVGNRFVYADFEHSDLGPFGHQPALSTSTQGIDAAGSTVKFNDLFGHASQGSQQIVVRDDPLIDGGVENPIGGWFVRQLAGANGPGVPGSRDANIVRPATGKVGFWAMTNDPGLEITIAIDGSNDVTADRGRPKPLIADGEWHVYEWNLEDYSEWEGWLLGDGLLDYVDFTLDSIQLFGPAADATLYLDDVFHEARPTSGPGAIDLNQDGVVDGADLLIWERNGADGADYAAWETYFGKALAPGRPSRGLPEPTAEGLFVVALAIGAARVRQSCSPLSLRRLARRFSVGKRRQELEQLVGHDGLADAPVHARLQTLGQYVRFSMR